MEFLSYLDNINQPLESAVTENQCNFQEDLFSTLLGDNNQFNFENPVGRMDEFHVQNCYENLPYNNTVGSCKEDHIFLRMMDTNQRQEAAQQYYDQCLENNELEPQEETPSLPQEQIRKIQKRSRKIKKQKKQEKIPQKDSARTQNNKQQLQKLEQCKRLKEIINQMEALLDDTKKRIVERILFEQSH